MTYKVKKTAASRGAKISAKHQITIPIAAVTAAGLRTGDRLRAEARGAGVSCSCVTTTRSPGTLAL